MADNDLRELDRFAEAIAKAPEAGERALVKAIDAGADFALKDGIDRITRHLNLPRSYIEGHMKIGQRAKYGDPTAVITGRRRQTTLRTYGGNRYATNAVKNRRRSKGDRRRGIAKGRKAAGILPFQVTRAKAATGWAGGFIVFLNRGRARDGSNVAMATRNGPERDDFEIHYGPSVGGTWSFMREETRVETIKVIEREFEKEFKRLR